MPQIGIIGLLCHLVSKLPIMDFFETQETPKMNQVGQMNGTVLYLGSMGAYLLNKMSDESKSLLVDIS